MAKLDKQGLNTFIRELDKHINTKINRLDITPKAEKVTIADTEGLFEATNVEDALLENKESILELQNEVNGQRLKLINSINETIELL